MFPKALMPASRYPTAPSRAFTKYNRFSCVLLYVSSWTSKLVGLGNGRVKNVCEYPFAEEVRAGEFGEADVGPGLGNVHLAEASRVDQPGDRERCQRIPRHCRTGDQAGIREYRRSVADDTLATV